MPFAHVLRPTASPLRNDATAWLNIIIYKHINLQSLEQEGI